MILDIDLIGSIKPHLYSEISSVGVGKSTVTISSSIIGIFQLKFYTVEENGERAYIQVEEDVEIVIGRDKVKAELGNFYQLFYTEQMVKLNLIPLLTDIVARSKTFCNLPRADLTIDCLLG